MQLCPTFVCAWDWVGSNAATIIALAAVLVSLWTALVTRLNARMSALPLLHTVQEKTAHLLPDQDVSVLCAGKLVNGGLGPAIVTKYQVFVDGVLLDPTNGEQTRITLAQVFGQDPADSVVKVYSLLQAAISIAKDESELSFSLESLVPEFTYVDDMPDGFERIALRVEYQSMYGDELLFESAKASLPPRLSLFWKLKR